VAVEEMSLASSGQLSEERGRCAVLAKEKDVLKARCTAAQQEV
jgi:hypothetical protein